MIYIIGDTVDELADLQALLETGILNSNEDTTIDVTYKLSSGGILLVDQYNHIVGAKSEDKANTFTDAAAGYPLLVGDLPAEEKRCMNCGHRFENEDYPGSACFNCHELSNWEG